MLFPPHFFLKNIYVYKIITSITFIYHESNLYSQVLFLDFSTSRSLPY